MIASSALERARSIPIEDEVSRRGVKLRGRVERVGPCPRCGGTDRFGINTRKRIFACRQCHPKGGDVIELVRFLDGLLFAEAVEKLGGENVERPEIKPRQRVADPNDYERRQAAKAQWLWLQRCPIASSPAERYLREARHYSGPVPATLGFLPPSKPEHHPAMIAAFALCDEPEPGLVGEPRAVDAVHLTLLKPDGAVRQIPSRTSS